MIPEEIIATVISDVERAIADRSVWERKQRKLYSQRYGIRNVKTFPWPGCANLHIPLTDKVIRRLIPTFQSAVFRVNPVVTIEPFGGMSHVTARTLEHGYDWLVRYNMERTKEEMLFIEDACVAYGLSIGKACWERRTEVQTRTIEVDFLAENIDPSVVPDEMAAVELTTRLGLDPVEDEEAIKDAVKQFKNGDESITVSTEIVTYDAPRWYFVDAMDFIVPWDSGTDIDAMPWCCHRTRFTKKQLEEGKKDGRYNPEAADLAIKAMRGANTMQEQIEERKRFREGVIPGGDYSTRATVWEVYFRYDGDGDGLSEIYVLTYAHDAKAKLSCEPYHYEHGEMPFTRFAFEATEPRWYSSRGVVEMLSAIQEEVNAQHNAKLDNMAIKNSASFVMRAGATRDKNWRFRPGYVLETQRGPQDVIPIMHQPMDFSFNAEEENLRAWAEEYIGTPDFGISNINQRVERRTAAEVNQIQQSTGAVADASLERFQDSMRRFHRQTLFLWAQYGDDQVMVRVTGKEFDVPFVRFDIYRDYDLAPTGRLDNLSPQMRMARAGAALDMARDPISGPYVNTYEVVREIFENLDYRNSERFLNEPGTADQNAVAIQVSEVTSMQVLGEVWPVDQRDPHQVHIGACERALQNEKDEAVAELILAHTAIHMFFAGEKTLLQQFVQQGWQPIQSGTKVVLIRPQQPQQQQQPTEANAA